MITVVLGYPKEEPQYKKGRLSLEFVLHFERYKAPDKSALDRIVAEYDDHQKHIGLIDNWEKEGFLHYLDWFYTKWAGKPSTEKIFEFQKR